MSSLPVTEVMIESSVQDLLEEVLPTFTPSRQKDVKTAVRVLIKALGYQKASDTPALVLAKPLEDLVAAIEPLLGEKGEHTRRNMNNNLSAFYRALRECGLLPSPPPKSLAELETFDEKQRRPRKGSEATKATKYYLPFAKWPQALQEEFRKYEHWATARLIPTRPAKFRKRAITVKNIRDRFCAYFGYLHNIRKLDFSKLSFNSLVNLEHVSAFADWHVNTLHQRVTASLVAFLWSLHSLVTQYLPDPKVAAALKELMSKLDRPDRVYDKKEMWVPLAKLEEIGMRLWPRRPGGRRVARRAGLSLVIRLLIRRPYRQRNIREMELIENLYQNEEGKWMIKFAGEGLKVDKKKGKTNHFELPFPEDLVPVLEEYLKIWRPILVKDLPNPTNHVFLTEDSKPFSEHTLRRAVESVVYRYAGKALNPHLIRTIRTTEYIRDTKDFYGAAILLNDTLETVISNYAEILHEGMAVRGDEWFKDLLVKRSPDKMGERCKQLAVKIADLLSHDSSLHVPFMQVSTKQRIVHMITQLLGAEGVQIVSPHQKGELGILGPLG